MSGAKFTQGSTMRHVVVMTLTSSAGLLALFFVDAVNLFYISLLGVTELAAAIGFAGTIQFFMISISIGLLIAASATISAAIGRGDQDRARHLATNALITAFLALGVLASVVWVFRREALMLLGANGEALDQASLFLAIALPSVPLIGIGMSCSGTLRAIGAANRAMYVTLGGGLVAAVLDPILIFGLDLGLVGAAIAIVLTRASIAAIGLYLVIAKHDMLARPSASVWLADQRQLLAIAMPAMATQLSTPFGNAYLTTSVAEYGDSAVAGWAVIGRLTALAFGGIFALAGAVGPIIGQNYGAKLWPRIAATYRDGLIFTAIYVALAWMILRTVSPWVIEGFALTGEGALLVEAFTSLAAASFVFTGVLFTANAVFNNLGRPLWSTMFNWSRDALTIPLLVFVFAGSLGPTGAVWIQAMAAVIVGTTAGLFGWRVVRIIAERPVPETVIPSAAPVPAFASGRIGADLVPDSAAVEPLASKAENR